MYAQDSGNILKALSFSVQPEVHPDIPALNLPDKASQPHDQCELDFSSLDFLSLVKIHRQHKTRYAKLVVWAHGAHSDSDLTVEEEMSIKKQFLQEYRDILKEEQSQGLSMGKNWQDQWPNNHGARNLGFGLPSRGAGAVHVALVADMHECQGVAVKLVAKVLVTKSELAEVIQ